MADTKTSAESAAAALGGTELVRGVQGGANVKITADQIKTLAWTSPTFTGTAAFAAATFSGAATFNSATFHNSTLNLTAGQIAFPATANPSAGANTLDDYEEGTYTPGITFAGAAVGVTYTSRAGFYTKIGDRVFFDQYIVLSSKGSSVGAALISTPPFTQSSTAGSNAGLSIHLEVMTSISGHIDAYVVGGSQTLSMGQLATGTWAVLQNTNFNNTSQIGVSGQYRI